MEHTARLELADEGAAAPPCANLALGQHMPPPVSLCKFSVPESSSLSRLCHVLRAVLARLLI